MNTHKNLFPSLKTWYLFPPVVSVPLILLLFLAGHPLHAHSIPAVIWTACCIGYLFMCIAFAGFVKARNYSTAAASSIVAQGIVSSTFSLSTGSSSILSWGNLLVLTVGGLLAMRNFLSPKEIILDDILFSTEVRQEEIEDILQGLPLPSLFTDNDTLIAINDKLGEILKLTDAETRGKKFNDIFPERLEETHTVYIHENPWHYHCTQRGARALVILSPQANHSTSSVQHASSIIDPETGLYTSSFLPRKGKEEVERSQRYNRELTVVLIQLRYDESNSAQEHTQAYTSLASTAGNLIRSCDVAFRLDNEQVLLFLPDTPLRGAHSLIERIAADLDRLSAIESLIPSGCHIHCGIMSYTGKGKHTVASILQDVHNELDKQHDDA